MIRQCVLRAVCHARASRAFARASTLAAALLVAAAARADSLASPSLALALVGGGTTPGLLLAQRTIDREWGPSEDSVYVTVEVHGWRSEAAAMALSAAVPGAGQAYAGSSRAWWFALAEGAGWVARWIYLSGGHRLQDDAEAYAGPPADTTSRWSFDRWERVSNQDASELKLLYARDRDAFFDRIGSDPAFLAGWAGDPAATRVRYGVLREEADVRLHRARYTAGGLWINHLVAAFDAVRAARVRDMSLGHDVKLRVGSGWGRNGPALTATLRRTF